MNTQKLEQVPIDTLVPYARNARTHSRSRSSLRASLREFGFVSPAIIDGKYIHTAGHGRISGSTRGGLRDHPASSRRTSPKPRSVPTSSQTTSWRSTPDGTRRCSVELSDLQDPVLRPVAARLRSRRARQAAGNRKRHRHRRRRLRPDRSAREGLLRGTRRHLDGRQAPHDVRRCHLAGGRGKAHGRHEGEPRPDRPALRRVLQGIGRPHDPERLPQGRGVLQVPCWRPSRTWPTTSRKAERPTASMRTPKGSPSEGVHRRGLPPRRCVHLGEEQPRARTLGLPVAARAGALWVLQNGKHPWYSDRKQTTIWNYDKPKRNKDHPTSKPLDLLGYPIQNSSQENAVVVDTFGGSGSTLMACEQQLSRICYMMELDRSTPPSYCAATWRTPATPRTCTWRETARSSATRAGEGVVETSPAAGAYTQFPPGLSGGIFA